MNNWTRGRVRNTFAATPDLPPGQELSPGGLDDTRLRRADDDSVILP